MIHSVSHRGEGGAGTSKRNHHACNASYELHEVEVYHHRYIAGTSIRRLQQSGLYTPPYKYPDMTFTHHSCHLRVGVVGDVFKWQTRLKWG